MTICWAWFGLAAIASAMICSASSLRLAASGPGAVTADLIEADTAVTIHNPEHHIAELTDAVRALDANPRVRAIVLLGGR